MNRSSSNSKQKLKMGARIEGSNHKTNVIVDDGNNDRVKKMKPEEREKKRYNK